MKKAKYRRNFKLGDLVINISDYDLGFNDLYTILKPKEMAIVIAVDNKHGAWVKLYTESGTVGWYLNYVGHLRLVSDIKGLTN
jgi:hypothetical protein|tara:strand:+ start:787 stop:1035 length:249 start_codon:yes stop_codon:yes gene_type:complete